MTVVQIGAGDRLRRHLGASVAAAGGGAAGKGAEAPVRNLLVTRSEPFIFEMAPAYQMDAAEPFFVDWLSIHQTHEVELPVVDDGHVLGVDQEGQLVWKTTRKHRFEGSFETSVAIRCDGHTVWFEGNVSRFNRSNNLFGFSLRECISRVNGLLAKVGLPPFTMGRKFWSPVKRSNGPFRDEPELVNVEGVEVEVDRPRNGLDVVERWTGARITRIDLTANYATGSRDNARAYMEWLATQQHSARVKVGTHADGETVDWGRGSKRIYAKCYDKASEMARRGAPAELVEYCEGQGVIRFEVTVKSKQLFEMGCQYLGSLNMHQLELLFKERQAVMGRAEHTHDNLAELPNTLRRTARDYLAGDDLVARMKPVTFWRHRKGLLPYGIDIAVRRNVIDFKPRVRVIELAPLAVPSWYEFDERKAA